MPSTLGVLGWTGRRYPSSAATDWTIRRVSSLTPLLPERARETANFDSPVFSAIVASVIRANCSPSFRGR